jgi:hypothetical protein
VVVALVLETARGAGSGFTSRVGEGERAPPAAEALGARRHVGADRRQARRLPRAWCTGGATPVSEAVAGGVSQDEIAWSKRVPLAAKAHPAPASGRALP